MDCKANMVAEGGVFSLKIGLRLGVTLPVGVGVSDPDLVELRSGDRLARYSSYSESLGAMRLFSGDRRSRESLSLLTLLACIDCMRLCCGLASDFSGDEGLVLTV